MKISWGGANHLSCNYNQPSNGGGGGGAGQVWIGEINVTPGQRINFNIGVGGDIQSNPGSDGNNGGATSIVIGGSTIASVSGGKGGVYEYNDTYIENSGGLGGGIKTTNFSSSAVYRNWITDNNLDTANIGKKGDKGYLYSETQNGAGGNGGGVQSNGISALSDSYGSGGGGGGASSNGNFGTGGKGANGYIYIEWGNANGGGGASGQVITERNVLVSAGTTIEIKVGKGGIANEVLTTLNGTSGYFGQKGNDGGESYIIVPPNTDEKHGLAKGGIGGYPAGTDHGLGGNYDDAIQNSIMGKQGNNEYGGNGGNITQELCPLIEAIKGLGGCGGNLAISETEPINACANPSSGPTGKNASSIGGGGGGGAVKDNAAYKGGNGANGAVILEWNN